MSPFYILVRECEAERLREPSLSGMLGDEERMNSETLTEILETAAKRGGEPRPKKIYGQTTVIESFERKKIKWCRLRGGPQS